MARATKVAAPVQAPVSERMEHLAEELVQLLHLRGQPKIGAHGVKTWGNTFEKVQFNDEKSSLLVNTRKGKWSLWVGGGHNRDQPIYMGAVPAEVRELVSKHGLG